MERGRPVDTDASRKRKRDDDAQQTATDDNPLGLPAGVLGVHDEPYRILTVRSTTFDDVVAEPDVDMLRKLTQVSFYFYPMRETVMTYVTYDPEDCAYEVTFAYPASPGTTREIPYSLLSALYRVCPVLIVKKPALDAENVTPAGGSVPELIRTVSLRYASFRRPMVAMRETVMTMYDVDSGDFSLAALRQDPAEERRVAQRLRPEPAFHFGTRVSAPRLVAADDAVPATVENPLGLAAAAGPRGQKYRLVTAHGISLEDVVAAPDLPLLRKFVRTSFEFYPMKRTALIYVTHDAVDCAYELTFAYPPPPDKQTEIAYDFLDALCRVAPLFVVKRPAFDASNTVLDGGVAAELVRTVSLRFASHRRQTNRVRDTVVLLYETETGELDLSPFALEHDGRDAKRRRLDAPAASGRT
jgi:hypothetical protein